MAFDDRSLDDYIDVPQRIADFREQHKTGSLEPADQAMPYHVVRVPNGWCRDCIGRRVKKVRGNWGTCPRCSGTGVRSPEEPQEDVFIVYAAAARRTPDDPHPGVGMAWEPYPGQTPYTAGSELQNAETSAWGRAIVAALASDAKKGVASRHEIRNRNAEHDDGLMTGDQKAEHTKLQNGASRGRVPGTKRTRGPIPAGEDMWSVPAAKGETGVAQIQMHFKRLDVTDRDERLRYTHQLTGHAVATTVGLTKAEQDDLLAKLAKCKNRAALDALAKQEVST